MTALPQPPLRATSWALLLGGLALFAAWRLQVFALTAPVPLPGGVAWLPNTFATVDHPFHVARAETLWRELGQGHLLRWIGQHQGGYPVEFYPLGEAWLEVAIRAASLGRLGAEGAHTLAVCALFLLPGLGFLALAWLDRLSPAVAALALAFQLALPGGWYHGGYTELVQWGLVTNVAGATAAFLMFPASLWFCQTGLWPALALGAGLGAAAVYSNPRSLVGVVALALGVLLGLWLSPARVSLQRVLARMALLAVGTALLAAPQLLALARFGDLYAFVHYSGYADVAEYARTSLAAVTPWVVLLAVVGAAGGWVAWRDAGQRLLATRSASGALAVYVLLTCALSFVPALAAAASQLETPRLMPVQRLLTLYLAAVGVWWLAARLLPRWQQLREVIVGAVAVVIVVALTRPPAAPIDPASPLVPTVGLYPVTMSAQPVQADLQAAIARADAAAEPGSALLVLGSGLSWHQALWAPLWTQRPLYYDNWLWSWRADRAGTPGYRAAAGNHYPDPEQTLTERYLAAHGVGGVVVTGQAATAAAQSMLLEPLGGEVYQAYRVRPPRTTVTFGDANAAQTSFANQSIVAAAPAPAPGSSVQVRVNWFPRWQAASPGGALGIERVDDGAIAIRAEPPVETLALTYALQPLDWLARCLVVSGLLLVMIYAAGASRWERTGYHPPSRPGRAAS